ncbi:hypothetical protein NMY22_g4746 [Coprinellus aureogranulatus]|nr:hypothetical protein NMY22_g4746 [Coprinellus aureogranulatus]
MPERIPSCAVVPDLTYLPKKYHPFVVSPLRRIYLDESTELINLERDVDKYKAKLEKCKEREEMLLKECERHQKKSRGYRAREQEARIEKEKLEIQCEMLVENKNLELQKEMKRLQEENEALEAKFNALKIEMEKSPKKQAPRRPKASALVLSDDSSGEESETAPSSPPRIVRPLPRRTRKFSSGATSLSPKAPAPKKARISDGGVPVEGRLPVDKFPDFRKQAYRSFVNGGRCFT